MTTQSYLAWHPPEDLGRTLLAWATLKKGKLKSKTYSIGSGIYLARIRVNGEFKSFFRENPSDPNVTQENGFTSLTWSLETPQGDFNCTIRDEWITSTGKVKKVACAFEAGTLPYGYRSGDGSAFKYQLLKEVYLRSGAIEAYGWNEKYPPDPDAPDFFGGKAFQFSRQDNQRLIVPFEESREPTAEELKDWDKWQIVVPPDDTGGRSYRGV